MYKHFLLLKISLCVVLFRRKRSQFTRNNFVPIKWFQKCYSRYCSSFNECHVLIWGGFFLMFLGRAVYIPYGQEPPLMRNETAQVNCE